MKKYVKYLVIALISFIIVAIGTYAYWSYESTNKKNISISTSKELSNYIVYDEGESKFAGELKVGNSYLDGVHTTISIKKTSEASNVELIATVNMTVNSIGDNIKNSYGLKWAITKGDSTSAGTVLNQGNFYGKNNDDVIELKTGIEVTTTEEKYTVWIWIDGSENINPVMVGEKLDTNVWTQVDQILDNRFEVTSINSNYQFINASAVNTSKNIVAYAVTSNSSQPSSYTNLGTQEIGNVYNVVDYKVSSTGTYYVWFKDSAGNVVNKSVAVSKIDTTAPVCTFSEFTPSKIKNGEKSLVELTCVDQEIGIKNSDITTSDIGLSSNIVTIDSNIEKTRIVNGFKYKITVVGTSSDGNATISLKSGIISNKADLSNTVTSSSAVTVQNAIGVPIPIQNGTLTYNTASQSPAWSNYDSSIMTLSGTTSGTNAGTYSATFTLKNTTDYKWNDGTTSAKTVSWSIDKVDVSRAYIPDRASQKYNGSAIKPIDDVYINILSDYNSCVKSCSGGNESVYETCYEECMYRMIIGTDYTIIYSNNINAGTGTAVITGVGNFTGSKTTTFTITKATVSVPSQSGTLTYNNVSQSPRWYNYNSSTVSFSGTTSAINAGTYTATASLVDSSNYTWSDGTTASKSVSWKINQYNISSISFSLSTTNYAYTGGAISVYPTASSVLLNENCANMCSSERDPVTCTDQCERQYTYTLVRSTDYTLSYSNNVGPGTATVKITGIGNFTGSKSLTYYIYTWKNTSNNTYYTDMGTAVSNASSGNTIQLAATYNESASSVLIQKDLTIDTNGKTVTFTEGTASACSISMRSNTINFTGTGTISGRKCLLYVNGATVNIKSGNFITSGVDTNGNLGSAAYISSGTLNLGTTPSNLKSTTRHDIASRTSPYLYSGGTAAVYVVNGQFNMWSGYLRSDNTQSVATLMIHAGNTYHPVIDGGDILSENYVAIQNDSTSTVLEFTGSAHVGTGTTHSAIKSAGVVRINSNYDGRVEVEGQRRPYCTSSTSCNSGRNYATILYTNGYGINTDSKAAVSFGSGSATNLYSGVRNSYIENWGATIISKSYPFANATKVYFSSGWVFHGTSQYYLNSSISLSSGRSVSQSTPGTTTYNKTFGSGGSYSKQISIPITKTSYVHS